MTNELMHMLGQAHSGWLFSGKDRAVMTTMLKGIWTQSALAHCIQVVILTEDCLPKITPLLTQNLNNRGCLPSESCGYFPIFSGHPNHMKERLMTLLRMTQADAQSVQAVQDYIDFTIELEEKCNLAAEVNEAFLQKYLSLASVERAIRDAIAEDRMDAEAYEAWLAEYAACSAGRIRLKSFFRQMDSYFAIHKEARQSIRTQNPGESLWFVIKSDMPEEACKLLFQMIGWDILDTERKGKRVSLSVIEGSKKYNTELLNLLNVTGADISFSLFSQDFFAGHSEEWKEKISEYFQRFVYSAHTRMESCEEISSKKFGTVPVVRNSYTVDRDRRIGNNHLLDQLLNTNRVDHYIQHTPVWEPRYRKEEIYEMPSGTCLVQTEDFEGFIQCL